MRESRLLYHATLLQGLSTLLEALTFITACINAHCDALFALASMFAGLLLSPAISLEISQQQTLPSTTSR
jgi:uncharacterized metal-binding protein